MSLPPDPHPPNGPNLCSEISMHGAKIGEMNVIMGGRGCGKSKLQGYWEQ